MKEEKQTQTPLSVFTKKFWEKNLILIPGLCSLMGTLITILIKPARYNIEIALAMSVLFLLLLLQQRLKSKYKLMYKIYSYFFAAISPMTFLWICTFRLTFKAPCFLSLSDWINVLLIWFVIFISTIALDLASAKLSNNS